MSDEQCGADPFENGYDQKLSEKEYRERIKYLMRCHDDSADEIERLRAENERLRRNIYDLLDDGDETDRAAARAALGEEKK
jgi:cell division protein FtsB